MLDPFARPATVEGFSLSRIRETLDSLPPIEGQWVKPASLSRLMVSQMPLKMLKRFEAKIKLGNLGHVPDADSPWKAFNEPCWLWTGGLHDKGYGRFWLGKDPGTDEKIWAYAHRISFEHYVGIPKPGYIVDHQCNVKTCCNPVHLWPVSNAENLRLADIRTPWKRRNQYSKE